jgi:hypothetical protein
MRRSTESIWTFAMGVFFGGGWAVSINLWLRNSGNIDNLGLVIFWSILIAWAGWSASKESRMEIEK